MPIKCGTKPVERGYAEKQQQRITSPARVLPAGGRPEVTLTGQAVQRTPTAAAYRLLRWRPMCGRR